MIAFSEFLSLRGKSLFKQEPDSYGTDLWNGRAQANTMFKDSFSS